MTKFYKNCAANHFTFTAPQVYYCRGWRNNYTYCHQKA